MGFETEPLRLKPLAWLDTATARGLVCGQHPLISVSNGELARALQELVRLQAENENKLTLKNLVLALNPTTGNLRLEALKEALLLIHRHGFIEHPAADAYFSLFDKNRSARVSLLERVKAFVRKSAQTPVSSKNWDDLPLLRQMSPEGRNELLRGAYVRTFTRGAHLCREGARDRDLMILLTGSAAVMVKTPYGRRVVTVLEREAMLGETGFFLKQARTADVVALGDCQVLCIPAKDNVPLLERPQFHRLQLRLRFLQALKRNPSFNDIPAEAFDALLLNGSEEKFGPGQVMAREGADASSCFFLIEGTVTVSQNGRTINRLASGSVIGEIALMSPAGKRTASATAESEVVTIKYDRDEFWAVLSQHFILALALESIAERRLARDELHRTGS